MNKYLTNLNRLEFVVTMTCTGHCKHCSEGEHMTRGERTEYVNPYIQDPNDIRAISFSPNGDVLHGNVNEEGMLTWMEGQL